MRTRFLTKLTNGEVESYLEKNDLIYVPVGVTETHGALPLDSETVLAEAIAYEMAGETDGLVLHNLPYFFAGATPVGRGTVQMSVKDGMIYLDKIAKSLLKQGFKRQIYVTCHGPAHITMSGMVRDFFDETKVPILYIDMVKAIGSIDDLSFNMMEKFNDIVIGAYDLLGRLDDVPLNIPESNSVSYDPNQMLQAMMDNPAATLEKLAHQSGAIGYYFDQPSDHMYTPLLQTSEERQKYAQSGVKAIHEIVEKLNMTEIVQTLKAVDQFTQSNSLKKYGDWL